MSFRTPQRRVLSEGEGHRIVLTWYPPGHTMAAHDHHADQRSILLAGALKEEAGRQATEVNAGVIGFKAAGVVHANTYGRDGALILAIDGVASDRVRSAGDWQWQGAQGLDPVRKLLGSMIGTSDAEPDAANDLDALLDSPAETGSTRQAEPWLKHVKSALDDDPAGARAERLAADVGVHRVHLSRRFAIVYGTPFTLYRRRAMTSRAVRALLQDRADAGAAAADAGFADQSHFTRALKCETGMTPARLASALG